MFLKIQNKIHKITKEVNYIEISLPKYFERQIYDTEFCVLYLKSSSLMEKDTRTEVGKVIKHTNQKYIFISVSRHIKCLLK